MKRTMTIALLCLGFLAPAAYAQAPAALNIKPIKDGLYEITGAGGNVLVRFSNEGLIVVDDKLPGQQNFDNLVRAIRTVSDQPVKYVFNTHVHPDHAGNNQRFIDQGAAVIAPKAAVDQLKGSTSPPNAESPAPPTVAYDSKYVLQVKGARVEAYHFGPGHSASDSVILFPDLKVAAFGDVFAASSRALDYAGGGALAGTVKVLDEALKLDFDVAIPGHGDEPLTKADVRAHRDKVATLLSRARALVAAGTPKDQLIAKLDMPSLGWDAPAGNWLLPVNVDGLYAEASR